MAKGMFRFDAMFFDQLRVVSAADKATRRVLSRFGAYVRTSARSSIRRRKKASKPGGPPTNRTGFLKKFIFFGYDPSERNIVIGPMKLNGKSGDDIPSVLEYGGNTTAYFWDRSKQKSVKKRIKVAARPFMAPALKKNLPQLPAMWKNSIR